MTISEPPEQTEKGAEDAWSVMWSRDWAQWGRRARRGQYGPKPERRT